MSTGASVSLSNNKTLLEITEELALGLKEKWPNEIKEFKRAHHLL